MPGRSEFGTNLGHTSIARLNSGRSQSGNHRSNSGGPVQPGPIQRDQFRTHGNGTRRNAGSTERSQSSGAPPALLIQQKLKDSTCWLTGADPGRTSHEVCAQRPRFRSYTDALTAWGPTSIHVRVVACGTTGVYEPAEETLKQSCLQDLAPARPNIGGARLRNRLARACDSRLELQPRTHKRRGPEVLRAFR